MKAYVYLAIICASTWNVNLLYAQILEPTTVAKPVQIRESDIMWAKRVWRVVDLREKMNQVYYYPLAPQIQRKSLIQVILWGVDNGSITPYDPYHGDEFQVKMSKEAALGIGSRVDTLMIPDSVPPYTPRPRVFVTGLDYSTIKRFKIKEEWVFDRQRSVMEARIIGICPVREVIDPISGELRGYEDMFWIYFPEASAALSQFKMFNPKNSGQQVTYTEAFQMRMFSSLIYKEDNVQDRRIEDYLKGVDALLEAENIKNSIFEFEHELWEP